MHTTRSFVHVLTLMLVFFKVTGQLDWSWWGVFTPFMVLYFFIWCGAILEVLAEKAKESQKVPSIRRN